MPVHKFAGAMWGSDFTLVTRVGRCGGRDFTLVIRVGRCSNQGRVECAAMYVQTNGLL